MTGGVEYQPVGMDVSTLDEVAAVLREARRVLFVTGAGVSADSGLPTYRGVGGLYDDGATEEGMSIEDVLSGETMQRDPALCWRYIAQIEQACRGATPNAAHRIIAELEQHCEVVVLTQNVDGLHRKAGSRELIEIHGTVHTLTCTDCDDYLEFVDDYASLDLPPRCPRCRAWVRPAVVLFGEMLPRRAISRLVEACARPFDLVFTIGTTSVFPYIAAPVLEQVRAGRPAVEINPGRSSVSDQVTWRLRSGAADAMEALKSRLGAI